MLAPRASLDKLKCSECRRYLSFFPIHILKNNVKICGRCTLSPPEHSIQDETFQQLAKFLRFPCIYSVEGCLSTLLPSEVPNHEKSCTFRFEYCPTRQRSKCDWRGPLNEVIAHCDESHPNFFLKNCELELDFITSNYQENLLKVRDEQFVFKRMFDAKTNQFNCCVVRFGYNDSTKNFSYRITLQNVTGSVHMYVPETEKDVIDRDDYIQVSLDVVNENLEDPSIIICKVELSLKEEKAVNKKNQLNLDLELISDFECPVCFEHMIAEIFLCETGHSICPTCKIQVKQCPTCRSAIRNARNFGLEKMASRNNFPCKYKDLGCNMVAKPEVMIGHQKYCNSSPHKCPVIEYIVDCKWNDSFMNMLEHVKNDHHENFLEMETVEIFIDDDYLKINDSDYQILSAFNSLFILHYLFDAKSRVLNWALQLIGPPEHCKKFMFEIDIVDNSGSGLRTYFKSFVSPLTTRDTFNKSPNKFVSLDFDNIGSYIHNGSFTYGVRILQ